MKYTFMLRSSLITVLSSKLSATTEGVKSGLGRIGFKYTLNVLLSDRNQGSHEEQFGTKFVSA